MPCSSSFLFIYSLIKATTSLQLCSCYPSKESIYSLVISQKLPEGCMLSLVPFCLPEKKSRPVLQASQGAVGSSLLTRIKYIISTRNCPKSRCISRNRIKARKETQASRMKEGGTPSEAPSSQHPVIPPNIVTTPSKTKSPAKTLDTPGESHNPTCQFTVERIHFSAGQEARQTYDFESEKSSYQAMSTHKQPAKTLYTFGAFNSVLKAGNQLFNTQDPEYITTPWSLKAATHPGTPSKQKDSRIQ